MFTLNRSSIIVIPSLRTYIIIQFNIPASRYVASVFDRANWDKTSDVVTIDSIQMVPALGIKVLRVQLQSVLRSYVRRMACRMTHMRYVIVSRSE